MKLPIGWILPACAFGLASCVAPGIHGPGGTVQGTANVEALERQSPVTPVQDDAGNAETAAFYGSGRRYYRRYYGKPCGYGDCYHRPRYWD